MEKKEKKQAVLMLSTHFMKGHSKAGQPTRFIERISEGKKLHTIRGNYPYWARRAEKIKAGDMELSIRVWEGKPYDSPQVEKYNLQAVTVQKIEMSYSAEDEQPQVWIDGECYMGDIAEIAHNDGLEYEDWLEWMLKKSNTFEGVIIHFTGLKY